VPVAEEERARKALIDLPGSMDLDQLTPEEIASLALPESEGIDPDETEADPAEPAEDWDDQENVSEVWAGENEDLANNLAMSLRENGISAHLTVGGSQRRLVVHPDKETRAKEIVREVVEASPPE
jgi:cell division septation protein DedD